MSSALVSPPLTQGNGTAMREIDDVYALVRDEMQLVNAMIMERLRSDVALINQMGAYIVNSGGKRLRPVLNLLSANAMGYQGRLHINLATIIEFIHTATLLHDDVVDASDLRRGHDTANAIWGNEAAVLVGDFLYSRSFEMMVEVGNMPIMEVLAHATNTIAEGEVMQLLNCHDPETTEERYLNVIRCKTAKLFEAATRLGGIIAGAEDKQIKQLADYGMHLGTAFQIIDDVLDYSATPDEIGKNIGDDLAEGKPTLPLIYTMAHGTPAEAALIRDAIENASRDNIDKVRHAIETTGAIAYTARAAQAEAERALASLAGLPESPYLDAMRLLARFSVYRNY